MPKIVEIEGIALGDGRPKICISIGGTTEAEINSEIEAARRQAPDFIEWRADFYKKAKNPEAVIQTLQKIKTQSPAPIIFTLRRRAEGGGQDLSEEKRRKIIQAAMQTGLSALCDIELGAGMAFRHAIFKVCRAAGAKIILSQHDFEKTPRAEKILFQFAAAQAAGADIAKIALMPQTAADVETLMSAAAQANERLKIPVIAISMSKRGEISRTAAKKIGSCLVYAAGKIQTAPGQITAAALREKMTQLDEKQPLKQQQKGDARQAKNAHHQRIGQIDAEGNADKTSEIIKYDEQPQAQKGIEQKL